MSFRALTARHRDLLLVVLTLTTGTLDAVSFVKLGKVFSSVITGNLALLGIAAGERSASLAENAALALAGYAAGAAAASLIAGIPEPGQPVWPHHVTRALAAETAVLAAFSGLWLADGASPAGGSRVALLVMAGVVMGMQSATIRRLGQMSTTYLTSTLTAIITDLALRRRPADGGRSGGILLAFVIGAALGTLLCLHAPYWVPVPVLVPILLVLAGSLWPIPLRADTPSRTS
jgi:uncharacterized membrane protein YoaK (UPF0700 family)